MVNLDELSSRGLTAYERGRVRMALRAALVLVPLAAFCLLETRGRAPCCCAATLLIVGAVLLRWQSRRGVEAVTSGILAGLLPLLAGVLFRRFDIDCEPVVCVVVSLVAGGIGGVVLGVRSSKQAVAVRGVVTAIGIASLATSLGCLRLGAVGLASMIGGIVVGLVVTRAAAERREA